MTLKYYFTKMTSFFFDNEGSILRFNNDTDLVWKRNNYIKSEKKQNPILFFANNKKTLIVADNISKYYSLDINTGKILWSKIIQHHLIHRLKYIKINFL